MKHDYDLPQDWAAMTDAERSRWMTQERCRRLHMRIRRRYDEIPTGIPAANPDRHERILDARGWVELSNCR